MQTVLMDAPLETMPLFFRAGAIIALGDPRLDTLVVAEDETVTDPQTYGPLILLRASPGTGEIIVLADGSTAEAETNGNTISIVGTGDVERDWVVELFLPADSAGNALSIEIAQEEAVSVLSLGEFWDAAEPVYYSDGDRLFLKAKGFDFEAQVSF